MGDCSEVRSALLEGREPRGAQLEAHMEECPVCREWVAKDAALGRWLATAQQALPRVAEGDLAAAVMRDLERDAGVLGRLRALRTRHRATLAAALALLPTVLLSIDNPRTFTPARWVTVAFGVLLVVACHSALAPLSFLRRHARNLALAALALGVPALRFFLIGSTTAHATNEGWECFAIGMLSSAPVYAMLHVMARRPPLSFVDLSLAGGIAGLAGNMALQLHCVDKRLDHLLAGHALVGFVWLASSWLALRLAAQRT